MFRFDFFLPIDSRTSKNSSANSMTGAKGVTELLMTAAGPIWDKNHTMLYSIISHERGRESFTKNPAFILSLYSGRSDSMTRWAVVAML